METSENLHFNSGTEAGYNLSDRTNDTAIDPQTSSCPTCNSTTGKKEMNISYIYALDKISPRFPSLSLEKEFMQVAANTEFEGLTENQLMSRALKKNENRYLMRQLCWVFSIQGIDTYILRPRDIRDYDLLADAVREEPRPTDVDVIVGYKGAIASPDLCNGLMVPTALFDQVYSFDIDSLIGSLPKINEEESSKFTASSEELFWRVMQMTDNAGSIDEHRALNYLAVRYHRVYHLVFEQLSNNCFLSAIESKYSRLSGVRKILDIIFSFRNRNTDVEERYFVRVDVTEEFPFLVNKLSPYYERQ